MSGAAQYKRIVKLSKELSSLPVISYYLKLYAAELILNNSERSEDTTQLIVSLLDSVENFKNQQNDEGTALLLNDKAKALAFVMNFVMSIYNGVLVQIQDCRVNADVGKSLICCVDLFQCCKHIWGETMDLVMLEQCDKRIKYAKFYLMKFRRGELGKPQETEEEAPSVTEPAARSIASSGDKIPAFLEDSDEPIFPEVPEDLGAADEEAIRPEHAACDEQPHELDSAVDAPIESRPEVETEAIPDFLPSREVSPAKTPKVKHDVATLKQIMTREESIHKVQRNAKYAISALNYDDIPTAKAELQEALALLDKLTIE